VADSIGLPTDVPTFPCPNVEPLFTLTFVEFKEDVDIAGPFPKAVGTTGGAFWGMNVLVIEDEVIGTGVAAGGTKGLSTMNDWASLRMRDCLFPRTQTTRSTTEIATTSPPIDPPTMAAVEIRLGGLSEGIAVAVAVEVEVALGRVSRVSLTNT